MKQILLLTILIFLSCKNQDTNQSVAGNNNVVIVKKGYELIKSPKDKALLILFPGGGQTLDLVKKEFDIINKSTQRGISVLLVNFNRNLWLEQKDSEYLTELLTSAISDNNIATKNIFIGGMSLGGTVTLSLSDHLIKTKASVKPKGLFVIDSPIDLYALYESSQKDVMRDDFSEERLSEPRWIINYFEERFGGQNDLLSNIQEVSPITLKTNNIDNIKHLKELKLRLYTEPDTLWQKEVRQTDFESTNAFVLQKTNALLKSNYWQNIKLIETKNKGYRSNGERHPHSWSIVDQDELIEWILKSNS